jgi:hypothetical protein
MVMDEFIMRRDCTLDQFEDFCQGFSEASSRFSIVDVGSRKDVGKAKILGEQPHALLCVF